MIFDLPNNLEEEILARVPSKSLAKLQTTCKRWYALFKDPKFVMKNNNLRKSKEMMLLIDKRVYSISVNIDLKSIDASMEFTGRLTRLEDSKDVELCRVFPCNGLILCRTNDMKSLVVWNPCTRETRSIEPIHFGEWADGYAFGCGNSESSCHNYKILRCTRSSNNSLHHVFSFEIYELSSDSWRVLDGVTDKWKIYLSDDVVSLKGNAYWTHLDSDQASHNVLLSFNFTTEVFVSSPLPDQSDDDHRDFVMSVVRDEHLAVLHHNTGTFLREMNVWLSNKIDEAKVISWSKFLVFSFDNFKYPRYPREMTFWVDDEKKVVVTCVRDLNNRDHVYIIGEDLHKHVYEVANDTWIRPCLFSYVPSFCHIPNAKEEETF